MSGSVVEVVMFTMEVAPYDNRAILGWFERSKCWFTMVWDDDWKEWQSFGGDGNFYGEQPGGWMYLPDHP